MSDTLKCEVCNIGTNEVTPVELNDGRVVIVCSECKQSIQSGSTHPRLLDRDNKQQVLAYYSGIESYYEGLIDRVYKNLMMIRAIKDKYIKLCIDTDTNT